MRLIKKLTQAKGLRVTAGPFAGLRCLPTEGGDGVIAKVCGTYELEIFPAIEDCIRRRPRLVANIGAAEGFYVAGFARRLPDARIVAYEAKAEWQARIRNLLRLNQVRQPVDIRGFCGKEEFRQLAEEVAAHGPALVFMDIEGGEWPLLLEGDLAQWGRTDFLVELHEPDSREPGEKLARKLEPTHEVLIIEERERSLRDVHSPFWRFALSLPGGWADRLNEGRKYRMRWLCAKSKAR